MVYTFKCNSCKRKFELFLRRSDEMKICPNCGSTSLTRIFEKTNVGIRVDGIFNIPKHIKIENEDSPTGYVSVSQEITDRATGKKYLRPMGVYEVPNE